MSKYDADSWEVTQIQQSLDPDASILVNSAKISVLSGYLDVASCTRFQSAWTTRDGVVSFRIGVVVKTRNKTLLGS